MAKTRPIAAFGKTRPKLIYSRVLETQPKPPIVTFLKRGQNIIYSRIFYRLVRPIVEAYRPCVQRGYKKRGYRPNGAIAAFLGSIAVF